jgi:hypothetical protein
MIEQRPSADDPGSSSDRAPATALEAVEMLFREFQPIAEAILVKKIGEKKLNLIGGLESVLNSAASLISYCFDRFDPAKGQGATGKLRFRNWAMTIVYRVALKEVERQNNQYPGALVDFDVGWLVDRCQKGDLSPEVLRKFAILMEDCRKVLPSSEMKALEHYYAHCGSETWAADAARATGLDADNLRVYFARAKRRMQKYYAVSRAAGESG